jgi:hypothetical protein
MPRIIHGFGPGARHHAQAINIPFIKEVMVCYPSGDKSHREAIAVLVYERERIGRPACVPVEFAWLG